MKMMLRRDKKDEEDGGASNPFQGLEKSSVIQEARSFNDTPIVPRKCCHILTKVMYVLNQGEQLGSVEATETFFAMTKLFQSSDVTLRRMVYLLIKEMADIADDVIIVTSSLTKDMTGKEDLYRAPAIRALCKITDGTMLQAIERFMKQAIVDKVPSVSSAALASSLHIMKANPDVVRRWVNEVQEAASSDNIMVQYHALGLLYYVRKNDNMAVAKMVSKYTRGGLKSPYATCLLIRISAKLLEKEYREQSPLVDFIESCLRHKSEMVVYEAAHAIVNRKDTTAHELAPAVSVLQLFLSSPKPTLRFAATKTLNKVAMTHPAAVTACNLDLENLITDVNRSIGTLAITTLLKTGSESSIDRLMKQISTFMSDISDEFKVVVVEAVSSLCSKFPRKYGILMSFLSAMLRDDGGCEYKKAIVNSLVGIIEENPEAKETGLSHLCEFIEDCEHTSLATRILHLLGQEGPRTTKPARYIRFIYNRVILENAAIRAAAVSCLAKFGAHCEALLPSILVLLERSLLDGDDEVRDRATFYLNILQQNQKALNSAYILNGLSVSVIGLERALHHYTLEPSEQPFDIKTVPLDTQPLAEQKTISDVSPAARPAEKAAAPTQEIYAEQLAAIPEFAHIGNLFKSSKPVELTESETEYIVRCIKHTFPKHIVFQFDCTNTLNDQQLEGVYVQMESAEGLEVECVVKASVLKYNQPGITYTLVQLPEDNTEVASVFSNTLKYSVKDCDPSTGEPDEEGYDDEYVLEDVELTFADHVQRVMKPNFMASWEEIGDENEMEETYALSSKSLQEAIKNVVNFLGMQPCERSDKVPEGKSSHSLFLAGVFRGGVDTLVKARLALQDTVTMQITVRSTNSEVSELITLAVG